MWTMREFVALSVAGFVPGGMIMTSGRALAIHNRDDFDAYVGLDNGVGYSFGTGHGLSSCYSNSDYACADVDYSDNAAVYATNEDEVNTWFYSLEVINLYANTICSGTRFQQYAFTGHVWSFGVFRGETHWLHLGPYASYPGWGWIGSSTQIGYADDGQGYYEQADGSWVYGSASTLLNV
jgi:hypothetical protein